ncbi:unnamed protein product [Sphagnum balticum]
MKHQHRRRRQRPRRPRSTAEWNKSLRINWRQPSSRQPKFPEHENLPVIVPTNPFIREGKIQITTPIPYHEYEKVVAAGRGSCFDLRVHTQKMFEIYSHRENRLKNNRKHIVQVLAGSARNRWTRGQPVRPCSTALVVNYTSTGTPHAPSVSHSCTPDVRAMRIGSRARPVVRMRAGVATNNTARTTRSRMSPTTAPSCWRRTVHTYAVPTAGNANSRACSPSAVVVRAIRNHKLSRKLMVESFAF